VPGHIEQLLPSLQPWARWLLGQARGGQLTSTWRSPQQQLELYLAYLRGESRYPAAPPGRSMHEQRRAFDIIAPSAELRRLGALWEAAGGRWGGRFNDPIHFEA
jgi:hypothetical protein